MDSHSDSDSLSGSSVSQVSFFSLNSFDLKENCDFKTYSINSKKRLRSSELLDFLLVFKSCLRSNLKYKIKPFLVEHDLGNISFDMYQWINNLLFCQNELNSTDVFLEAFQKKDDLLHAYNLLYAQLWVFLKALNKNMHARAIFLQQKFVKIAKDQPWLADEVRGRKRLIKELVCEFVKQMQVLLQVLEQSDGALTFYESTWIDDFEDLLFFYGEITLLVAQS